MLPRRSGVARLRLVGERERDFGGAAKAEMGRFCIALEDLIAETPGVQRVGAMITSRTLTKKHTEALEAFVTAVRRRLGERLVTLKLFGSHARGDAATNSDLDVLVLVEQANPALENEVLDLAFDVNLAHDVYISPRVISRRIFEDPIWRHTPFIRALETEGAVL